MKGRWGHHPHLESVCLNVSLVHHIEPCLVADLEPLPVLGVVRAPVWEGEGGRERRGEEEGGRE